MGQAFAAPKRALVVEDDGFISTLGAAMLEEFDFTVDQVASAEEALERLQSLSGQITVVLTDINLAGDMDGIALARSVSVLWPGISLIVTSGDPGARLDAMPDRAVYVPKPWRALDIVSVAERATREDHSLRSVRL